MLSLALRRLLTAVPTLFVLVALSFFLMHAAPGGPFDSERSLPPEIEARLAAEFHLDEALPVQFLRYLGGLLQGDLGPSFQYEGQSVSGLIASGVVLAMISLMIISWGYGRAEAQALLPIEYTAFIWAALAVAGALSLVAFFWYRAQAKRSGG